MPRKLLKYKNYDIQAVTTVAGPDSDVPRHNANIVAWMMATDMSGSVIAVALYKVDYTIELVRESGILNVNLLATDQIGLVRKFGQQSGRTRDKLKRVPYRLDERGCAYLTEAIGYVQCRVLHSTDAGDHELFLCQVEKQVTLNPSKRVLTYALLREKKVVRG
jgi:flavin reductase (DIM6/NTAB) family NADH-FMN oxidoreductase RutF